MRLLTTSDAERKAFDNLYFKYHHAVYRNIKKLIMDEDTALDVLQEVFLSLWENREKLLSDESVGGWLFAVSYNKSVSVLRNKVKKSLLDENTLEMIQNEVYEPAHIKENDFLLKMNIIKEAVNVLPPRKQEVYKLYRFEGMSREEVAEQTELSQETVKDYLKQSNQIIKRYIAHHYPTFIKIGTSIPLLDYFS